MEIYNIFRTILVILKTELYYFKNFLVITKKVTSSDVWRRRLGLWRWWLSIELLWFFYLFLILLKVSTFRLYLQLIYFFYISFIFFLHFSHIPLFFLNLLNFFLNYFFTISYCSNKLCLFCLRVINELLKICLNILFFSFQTFQ